MNGWKPHRRDDVNVRRSGTRIMLQDATSRKVHVLNPTAEFIWQHCDGKHTLDDIQEQLELAFDVPAHVDLRRDISRVISAMVAKSLLEPDH